MVNEVTPGGLIVAQAARVSELLTEVGALCAWPLLLRPSVRELYQQIEACHPACLLFWLEAASEISPATDLVIRLRNRGPRPYRIAVAHCLEASVEQTFRAAGVHSYFAANGNLHSLVHEAILPFFDMHRAPQRLSTPHTHDGPVPIRSPTEVRGSPATLRPP